jgi:hypothetical protein
VLGSSGNSQEKERSKNHREQRLRPAEWAKRRGLNLGRPQSDLSQERDVNVNARNEKKGVEGGAQRRK